MKPVDLGASAPATPSDGGPNGSADALRLPSAPGRDERFGLLLQLSPPRTTTRDAQGEDRAAAPRDGAARGGAPADTPGGLWTDAVIVTPATPTIPKTTSTTAPLPSPAPKAPDATPQAGPSRATTLGRQQAPRPPRHAAAHRSVRAPDASAISGTAAPATAAVGGPADEADLGSTLDPQQLVDRITLLCRRAGAGMVNWTVTLALDPQVMPDTVLRIKASQGWMRLRFSTQSAPVVALISAHLPRLQQLLEDALDMKHQLDIDFE